MNRYAIILAGGAGMRAGSSVPKQFCDIDGKPMFLWPMLAFRNACPDVKILLVVNPGCFDILDAINRRLGDEVPPYREVCGGRSRWESVYNGLLAIPKDEAGDALVAVHDAARPLVTPEMILAGFSTAEKEGSAVPVVPETNSLRRLLPDGGSESVDRSIFRIVQTPQVFRLDILRKGYSLPYRDTYTDDASVVEASGEKISLYEGIDSNIKVTNPDDFAIAEVLMKRRQEPR